MSNADAALILAHPFVLALVGLIAIWRPWREDPKALAPWALPLVLAFAYPLGRHAISSLPSFPPPVADEWLVFAAVAVGGWGIVEARFPTMPAAGKRTARLIFVAAVFWLMVIDHISIINYAFLVIGVATLIAAIDGAARTESTSFTLWTFAIVASASTPILLFGASFRLALLAATLGAVAAAGALVSTVFRAGDKIFVSPVVMPFCLLLAGLYVSGVRFAMAPFWSAIIIAVALLLPLSLCKRRNTAKEGRWKVYAICLALVATIAGSAVAYAYYETQVEKPPAIEVDGERDGGAGEGESDYDNPYTW